MPVCTSSTMNRLPRSSQRSLAVLKNSSLAAMIPPSPCMGSQMKAAVSRVIADLSCSTLLKSMKSKALETRGSKPDWYFG
ncbi:MAG: hypothetical protein A4E29_01140 [Methanomassiliicoccales archaeon PtaB.Bin134]|nr:MAG: hypothetical protein A4E29_01140 [Methanomassiliicoccales archaeon PtaB.Bin134]